MQCTVRELKHMLNINELVKERRAASAKQNLWCYLQVVRAQRRLRDCLEGMVDQDIYSRVTSKKMAYMSAGHMNQRCAESRLETPDMMQGELLDGMGSIASAPISLRKNAYRTKTKDAKAKKFWG